MWGCDVGVALACSGTHVTVGESRVEIGEFHHAPKLVNVDNPGPELPHEIFARYHKH